MLIAKGDCYLIWTKEVVRAVSVDDDNDLVKLIMFNIAGMEIQCGIRQIEESLDKKQWVKITENDYKKRCLANHIYIARNGKKDNPYRDYVDVYEEITKTGSDDYVNFAFNNL